MAEWLYEDGIGEARAALVADGAIVEALIEPEGEALRPGDVAPARLVEQMPGRQGRVTLVDGRGDAWLAHIPPGVTLGATLMVAITRGVIPERGRAKLAKAVATDARPGPAPDLLARITATGIPVRHLRPHEADALEAAGWSELLDEADSGEILFPTGALRMALTPAMTLFDVDGAPPLDRLALDAARQVALAIRRHGIGGSIGVDFPNLTNKAARQAVAAAIDAHLPLPFERTQVNGFGFLQIVRPRMRMAIPELIRTDPVGAAARAAMRVLERTPPGGPAAHRLPPAVVARIESHPDWIARLSARMGAIPILEPDR
ncbi:ribonuclease [Sphingomonas sp. Leaf17]|uniref:ribonuclease n=1 Tax=Sphingomonas sp. Leaf17 TaxID=1735683 RepID=UPI0006FDAB53|nr:ribonuclease [Sphingomonas sp. Leaf17]KQM67481.1 ribonuclease [Sphingomonas sp. Leaf17]